MTSSPTRSSILREASFVYVLVTLSTVAITQLPNVPGAAALEDYVHLLVGALFLVVAVRLAQRGARAADPRDETAARRAGMRRYGIDLAGVLAPPEDEAPQSWLGLADLVRSLRRALPAGLRESAVAIGIAALVFPAFVGGFYLWHSPRHAFSWQPPSDFISFAVAQVLIVGLPEEALFRGYFQTRLTDAWPARRRLLGASISLPALLLQAALFALLHFAVDLQPTRLAVFFPALLFGCVRAWRGGIGAAILLHAMSNVLAEILVRGWL